MFFKVLLFAVYTAFFYLQRVAVFKFGFGFLKLDLLYDFVVVALDLTHDLYLAHLHLLGESKALFDELFSLTSHNFKIAYDLVTIFL